MPLAFLLSVSAFFVKLFAYRILPSQRRPPRPHTLIPTTPEFQKFVAKGRLDIGLLLISWTEKTAVPVWHYVFDGAHHASVAIAPVYRVEV
jgi:hypothetical protein